jgi:hypothetical protein
VGNCACLVSAIVVGSEQSINNHMVPRPALLILTPCHSD